MSTQLLPDDDPFAGAGTPSASQNEPAQAPADRKGHFMRGAGEGSGEASEGASAGAELGELAEVAAVAA